MALDTKPVVTHSFHLRSLIDEFERLRGKMVDGEDIDTSYTFVVPKDELTLEKVDTAINLLSAWSDKGVYSIESDVFQDRDDRYFHSTRHAKLTYMAAQIVKFGEDSEPELQFEDRTLHFDALGR